MATDQERQDGLIITTGVLTTLSLLIVLTRSTVRIIILRKPGWDDYTILAAMFFMCGYFAELLICRDNGIGMPAMSLSLDQIQNFIKATLAIQCTYYAAIAFIKISILCMYLRFAVTRTLRVLCIGTIIFHACFFIVCISVTLAQCQPIQKMWDIMGTGEGSCINSTALFYFTSGLNIVTDIWILALPVNTLIGINRPMKEKVALVVIFGIGLFATIMSIVRLHTIYIYTLAEDPVRDGILVNLWSVIEVNAAIICASVPALKPLFTPAALWASRAGSGGSSGHAALKGNNSGPTLRGSSRGHSSGEKSGHIRSKMSVEQSWSENSANISRVEQSWSENAAHLKGVPPNSTTITGGNNGSDAGEMRQAENGATRTFLRD